MNTHNEEGNFIVPIPFDKLSFDPENPRLPTNVLQESSDQAVFEYMLSKANVTDLMFAIGESGYFDGEPLLVVPNQEADNYFVVEGNRRLAAVRLLHSPELAPIKKATVSEIANEAKQKPPEIPCIIYNQRSDILDFLGYRHITGIDEWDSLMKAKYLKQLYDYYVENDISQPPQLYQVLAKKIGSRSDAVRRLLDGYEIYKKVENKDFYGINNLDEESFSFSLLTTALSYSNIKEFVQPETEDAKLDESHLEELTKWVFEKNSENKTVIGESRNLKVLNSIVKAPVALTKLRNGTPLEEAQLFSEHPSKIFSDSLNVSYNRLKDAKSVSHHVQKYTPTDYDIIRETYALARELFVLIRDKQVDDFNIDMK